MKPLPAAWQRIYDGTSGHSPEKRAALLRSWLAKGIIDRLPEGVDLSILDKPIKPKPTAPKAPDKKKKKERAQTDGCGGCTKRKEFLNKYTGPLKLGDKIEMVTEATGIKRLVDNMAARTKGEAPAPASPPTLKWACGVTTTPERFPLLIQRTLPSLETAGFEINRLFIDFKTPSEIPDELKRFPTTARYENMGIVGNWILALWELLIRHPDAERFALFQDDFVTYKNLRSYLERVPYPADGYLNLYTFPQNEKLAKGQTGFYRSNQLGKGAVALVFNQDNAQAVLSNPHLFEKVRCPKRGKYSVDGGIVTAAKRAGRFEYVHFPSLVQHTGETSSMGNKKHPTASSFKGEHFDALTLLDQVPLRQQRPAVKPATFPPAPQPQPEEPSMNLGIMGTCCDTREGQLLREIAGATRGTRWLMFTRSELPTRPVPIGVGIFTGRNPMDFRRFLNSIETLVIAEDLPECEVVIPLANRLGVQTILIRPEPAGTGTAQQSAPVPRWIHFVDRVVTLSDWSLAGWRKEAGL